MNYKFIKIRKINQTKYRQDASQWFIKRRTMKGELILFNNGNKEPRDEKLSKNKEIAGTFIQDTIIMSWCADISTGP